MDNIKMDIQKWRGGNGRDLSGQGWDRWQALVHTVMNLQF
jgi:hypothetical protein